jgi:hypothetical protein
MEIEKTRGYGIAASDAESNWDPVLKAKIKKTAFKTILGQITIWQKIRLMAWFNREKRRAAGLDLSDLWARGMTNETFIKQQLEYISLFSALVKVVEKEKALEIMYGVMDVTAEALQSSLPEPGSVNDSGDSFEFFRKYVAVFPAASEKAGCHDITISEDSSNILQFDITWCVWFELAKKMDVPEACIPNCYADDLVYPDYFKSFGIKYCRKGTLAKGAGCCDFRFERI